MKRYWIRPAALFEYKPKGFPTFEIIKTDDIKDSLIVWHSIEKEGLPNINSGELLCSDGYSVFQGYLINDECGFYSYKDRAAIVGVIEWAYLPKPPKEQDDDR